LSRFEKAGWPRVIERHLKIHDRFCDFWAMSLKRECQRLIATSMRGNDTRANLSTSKRRKKEMQARELLDQPTLSVKPAPRQSEKRHPATIWK
jgi:hypothetical protein